jgi:hypothetical protein
MKDDDFVNLEHTVDTLDGHLTELQKQVIELQKENQRLKNLICQLASAVDTLPAIFKDSHIFGFPGLATARFKKSIAAVLQECPVEEGDVKMRD